MNAVIDKIEPLVAEELEAANAIHSAFHSLHEGWAVLKEEVEEADHELGAVIDCMSGLWHWVKNDQAELARAAARKIEAAAIRQAAEAIQVAAMARKFIASVSGSDAS